MATRYKVLGQVATAATTDTTLYTAPTGKDAVVSSLIIANRSTSVPASYRVAIRPGGAGIANQHYIAFDVPVSAADSTTLTLGITLSPGDIITVRASTANLSFSAFGSEVEL
jgi:hypothetical protein